jgi:16S rRNA (guanine527-N7)-methyltransferase
VREEFINAIKSNQNAFGVEMSDETIARLADYYEFIEQHNPILHLVAPCSPEEFATRHILESLTLLKHLSKGASFADIGAGAGLPSIPCLIAREDLRAVLIESKEKKTGFLQSVIAECKLGDRTTIINSQFSETKRPDVSFVTCRALDRFTQKLPQLLKWSGDCTLLFFGGPTLGYGLRRLGLRPKEFLMPLSERRFLFVAKR